MHISFFMNRKLVIDSIVDTYELPKKVKDNVKKIACKRTEELFINEYNSIYEYISFITDKFQTPYKEQFFIRHLEIEDEIEDQRFCPENIIFNTENSVNSEMSLEDVMNILKPYLDNSTLNLVKQLGNRNNGNRKFRFNTSSEYLVTNVNKIQERLKSLIEKYKKFEVLKIPKRPIIDVQFSPFSVKFKRRNYCGNPLAFFREHSEIYEHLSRTQLFKFDRGLYSSLRKYNQLELAIPENYESRSYFKPISLEKRSAIIAFHKHCKVAEKVAKEVDASSTTIIKYWKKHGLETLGWGSNKHKIKFKKPDL